ncbi:hypothetical protein [Granulicella sp. WH15]|uniref:hypothetical protein n=1 Tax=Granulicella sp. WH15 TaxID=2602070 RepID=UPI0021037A6C|nr:hypothetical protein [Granulicella sp. WH15]
MEEPTPTATGPVDLSALGSLLSAKWKTEVNPKKSAAKPAAAPPSKPEELKPGQIRSFKIATLDAAAKKITLELA